MITTFGQLKKAIAEAEQSGLSDSAPVSVVDSDDGSEFGIEEAVAAEVESNREPFDMVRGFVIGLKLIMEE